MKYLSFYYKKAVNKYFSYKLQLDSNIFDNKNILYYIKSLNCFNMFFINILLSYFNSITIMLYLLCDFNFSICTLSDKFSLLSFNNYSYNLSSLYFFIL